MTVTHIATSPSEFTPSSPNVGTADDVAYEGVAADRLAILSAVLKHITAVTDWAAVTGFTNDVNLSGGTGLETGSDANPTRIGSWRRTLTGSETGTVSVTGNVAPNCVRGSMSTYESSTGEFDIAQATGTDNTHGTGRSATSTTNIALAVGDVVHVAFANDTDNPNVVDTYVISASGITFSALTELTRRGTSTGSDATIITAEAEVTAGSGTVAITAGYSRGAGIADCGPVVFTRLRSVTSGTDVEDTADTTTTVGVAPSPARSVSNAAGVTDTTGPVGPAPTPARSVSDAATGVDAVGPVGPAATPARSVSNGAARGVPVAAWGGVNPARSVSDGSTRALGIGPWAGTGLATSTETPSGNVADTADTVAPVGGVVGLAGSRADHTSTSGLASPLVGGVGLATSVAGLPPVELVPDATYVFAAVPVATAVMDGETVTVTMLDDLVEVTL